MNEVLIYVPLEKYEEGIVALTKIETLKNFTIDSKFVVTKEEIASILGFKLPKKED